MDSEGTELLDVYGEYSPPVERMRFSCSLLNQADIADYLFKFIVIGISDHLVFAD